MEKKNSERSCYKCWLFVPEKEKRDERKGEGKSEESAREKDWGCRGALQGEPLRTSGFQTVAARFCYRPFVFTVALEGLRQREQALCPWFGSKEPQK